MSRHFFLPSWPALLVFFLGTGCLMAQETPPPAGVDDLPEVAAALKAGLNELSDHPEKAAGEFMTADRKANGKSFTALIWLATALLRADRPSEARDALERAGVLEGGDVDRGILFLLQDFARAVVALKQGAAPDAHPANASPQALAQAREKAVSHAQSAAASLRELLAKLPVRHVVGREARILLCQLRYRLPDIIPAPVSGEPIRIEESDRRPVGILQSQPRYPEEARRSKIQGLVVLETLVDREGCVVRTKTLSADHALLAQAAKETVETWVYEPTLRDGDAVDVSYPVTTSYRVQ